MTLWTISPSYKFDLACICNLFTGQDLYRKAHPQGWEQFKHVFNESQFHELAKMLVDQGYLVSSALIAIFDSFEYNGEDIEEICKVAEEPELRETVLRSYFIDHKILSPDNWDQYSPLMPQLTGLARRIHQAGFLQYWRSNCLAEVEQCCQDFTASAAKYPVIEEVNRLLGEKYALDNQPICLYLCKFSAPHGSSLAKQGFVSDIRWDMETTVAIALHEMLHPPFDRDKLAQISETLVQDDFVAAARKLLGPGYYSTPLMFVEENIVEGAHIYLAEKLGVENKPLEYFVKHDSGSHVLSVLLYQALKDGIAESGLCLEQVIEKMLAAGLLQPGTIQSAYLTVYERANLKEIVPHHLLQT